MKRLIFFAHAAMLSLVFLAHPCHSTEASNDDDFPYYVIIGAFASQTNAKNFTLQANAQRLDANFEMNKNRNLYYVFIARTLNREEAIQEVLRLREESPYKDAWVYNGSLGDEEPIASSFVLEEINPVFDAAIETAEVVETVKEKSEVSSETVVEKGPVTSTSNLGPVNGDLKAEELAGKHFVFQAYRATDNQLLDADIEVVDVDKSRRMHTFKSNMPVAVTVPKTKTGSVSFICQSFGYRKAQKDFSFKSPSTEGLFQDDAGNVVVPFELIRLQKGDIAVMYNVFYFKDAAIMRPESRYEVNNLLQMLNENSDYKIKLHGHTNGNAAGKIITRGESLDFFSLTNANDGFGSAKKLSEERAKAIRDYLVSNGIAEDRIEVKAWGGKRPIYDKHSTRAQENIRVEVEILDH